MLLKKSVFIAIAFVLLSKLTLAGGSYAIIATSQNDTICFGDTLFLTASSSPYGYDEFQWGIPLGSACYPSALFKNIQITFSTPGQYQIWLGVYAYGALDGWSMKTFTVLPLPTVSLTSPSDSICNTSNSITLSGGFPIGGIYSGAGVTGNVFDPTYASYDSSYIYYEYGDSFGCSSIDSSIVYIIKDCDTTIINTISVYPNPTNGEINFIGLNDDSNSEVYISDLTGKEIMHFNLINQKSVFLDFNAGIYIYKIREENGGITIGKFVLTK